MSKSKKSDYIEVFGYKIPRWPVCSLGELEALEAYHRTPGATQIGASLVIIASAITYRTNETVTPDDLKRLPVGDPSVIRDAIAELSASIDAARKMSEGDKKASKGSGEAKNA